uniref:Uncharacterized protein n=1 Tax=Arion vulgaris TaxID=1028688 RepID=A0A0B7A597_9EUPU
MASVDIINVIITADRKDDFENIYKSASLSRVKVGEKLGTAQHEHFVRSMRHLINQHSID